MFWAWERTGILCLTQSSQRVFIYQAPILPPVIHQSFGPFDELPENPGATAAASLRQAQGLRDRWLSLPVATTSCDLKMRIVYQTDNILPRIFHCRDDDSLPDILGFFML